MKRKKRPSRKGQVRACGYVWEPDGDGVGTKVHDRFRVVTWQFGDIHQSKVFVGYPKSRDQMDMTSIGICLHPGRTRVEAMQHGLAWVEKYLKEGPASPDVMFPDLFREWRTIYRTRLDVLDHIFFVIGNGYSWLDGAIICTSLYDEHPRPMVTHPEGAPEVGTQEFYALMDTDPDLHDRIWRAHCDADRVTMSVGPLPDDGKSRHFYPIGEYSDILCIPDDVRPDWLAVAHEAALALRDRQDTTTADGYCVTPEEKEAGLQMCLKNAEYGRKVVAKLDTLLKVACFHPIASRSPGPRQSLMYGSAATEVCSRCGKYRYYNHRWSDWIPGPVQTEDDPEM